MQPGEETAIISDGCLLHKTCGASSQTSLTVEEKQVDNLIRPGHAIMPCAPVACSALVNSVFNVMWGHLISGTHCPAQGHTCHMSLSLLKEANVWRKSETTDAIRCCAVLSTSSLWIHVMPVLTLYMWESIYS